MIHNKKTFKIILVLIIGIVLGKVLLHNSNSIEPVIGQHANYIDYLKDYEDKAWRALNDVGIKVQECEKHKSIYIDDLKEEVRAQAKDQVSPKTETIVRTVLDDFGVNQNRISVIPINHHCCAGATEFGVYVNELRFNTLTPDEQYFVIGHEIQHVIHEDGSTKYAMKQCDNQKTKEELQHALNMYSRFTEERADIKAALKNERYARGYVAYMERVIAGDTSDEKKGGITHPKYSKRLLMAKDILQSNHNSTLQQC